MEIAARIPASHPVSERQPIKPISPHPSQDSRLPTSTNPHGRTKVPARQLIPLEDLKRELDALERGSFAALSDDDSPRKGQANP
jgi:hypothetical protein